MPRTMCTWNGQAIGERAGVGLQRQDALRPRREDQHLVRVVAMFGEQGQQRHEAEDELHPQDDEMAMSVRWLVSRICGSKMLQQDQLCRRSRRSRRCCPERMIAISRSAAR